MLRSDYSGYYTTAEENCATGIRTTTGRDIVTVIEIEAPESARPDCVSVDELIAEREAEPGGAEALQGARKRIAQMLPTDPARPLRGLRLQAGLSQTDVAERIGTSQPHYARIESGTTSIQLITAIKLAVALGVDTNAIARLLAPEFYVQ